MKRLIYKPASGYDQNDVVEAMSVVNPKLCNKLGLKVSVMQGGEGPVPHVHVYRGNNYDSSDCAYIRLDKPEYSAHHKNPSKRLTSSDKKLFIEIINTVWNQQLHILPDGTSRPSTGYENAVDTWVNTYEEDGDYSKFTMDTKGNLVMPDYNLL